MSVLISKFKTTHLKKNMQNEISLFFVISWYVVCRFQGDTQTRIFAGPGKLKEAPKA